MGAASGNKKNACKQLQEVIQSTVSWVKSNVNPINCADYDATKGVMTKCTEDSIKKCATQLKRWANEMTNAIQENSNANKFMKKFLE